MERKENEFSVEAEKISSLHTFAHNIHKKNSNEVSYLVDFDFCMHVKMNLLKKSNKIIISYILVY